MWYPAKILIAVFVLPVFVLSYKTETEKTDIRRLWLSCKLENSVSFEIFKTAIEGYRQIDRIKKKEIISIVDFTKPSTEKRFFVIDLANKKLLYNCYVAHGKNSGENYAKNFSNEPESLMSSIGFYLTSETYSGKHGYSLRLDGLEQGINDNARNREIVIHGAKYVSETFIKTYGRLGRSWGCLALPIEISKEIIDEISDGSCLFIFGNDNYYKEHSVFLSRK